MPSPLRPLWQAALRDGGLAGLLSGLALAVRGRRDTGSAAAPLNAPSHWLFGDRALQQDGWSWRYTATGLAIHQGSAVFWGALHQWVRRQDQRPGSGVRTALVTTAAAAFTDFALTPPRLTPGFERRLSTRSLAWTYALFAVGLAIGGQMSRARVSRVEGRISRSSDRKPRCVPTAGSMATPDHRPASAKALDQP